MIKQEKAATWAVCCRWLRLLLSDRWIDPARELLPQILSTAVSRLRAQVRRKDTAARTELLESDFVLPGASLKNSCYPRSSVGEDLEPPAKRTKSVDPLRLMAEQAVGLQQAIGKERISLEKVNNQKATLFAKNGNLSKKLSRKDEQISSLGATAKLTAEQVSSVSSRLTDVEQQLAAAKEDRHRAQKQLSKCRKRSEQQQLSLRERIDALEKEGERPDNELDTGVKFLKAEIVALHDELKSKDANLDETNAEVQRLEALLLEEENADIPTFHMSQGRYFDNVRQCCMELLAHNVGLEHVGPVIRCVASLLLHRNVGRLPSVGLLSQLQVEMKEISQMHVAERVAADPFSTLHSDATTEFGHKYTGFQITTGEGTFSLGMQELAVGSAERTLDVLKEMLGEVQHVCSAAGVLNNAKEKIVMSIKNTMSDRGSVEKAFNTLFDSYREDMLPSAVDGWDCISSEAQTAMKAVNHFYCGLHYIVGLAEQAEAVLLEWEKLKFGQGKVGADSLPVAFETKGSAVVRLIRTACKSFTHHGSEKSGCHADMVAYLKDKGIKLHLVDFKGNRFNILFFNAAGVWYLREHIAKFLSDAHGTTNKLLQAVHADVVVPELLAGCRALGLFRKLVTGPLWRVLESRQTTVAAMSNVYQSVVDNLCDWSKDASSYLREHIAKFLSDAHGTTNKLLQAVHADVVVPELLAGCRALGLFRKLVTGPLWRVLESRQTTVAAMSNVYQSVVDNLCDWSKDASSLLDGSAKCFSGAKVMMDAVFDALTAPDESDSLVLELLQLLCGTFHTFSSRLLADHLYGGVHSNLSEEARAQTSSVPTTNRVSEKDFALLDPLVREKPNAALIALEGVILFANNKTMQWLNEKDAEEKQRLLEAAQRACERDKF